MNPILPLIGVLAAIYLIAESDPSSVWFVWGIVFATINGVMFLMAVDDR